MFFFRKKKGPSSSPSSSVKDISQKKIRPLPTTRLISKRNLGPAPVDKTNICASDISAPLSCSSTETENTQSTSQSLTPSLDSDIHASSEKSDDNDPAVDELKDGLTPVASFVTPASGEPVLSIAYHHITDVDNDTVSIRQPSASSQDVNTEDCVQHKGRHQENTDSINSITSISTTADDELCASSREHPPCSSTTMVDGEYGTPDQEILAGKDSNVDELKPVTKASSPCSSRRASGIPRLRSSIAPSGIHQAPAANKTAISHIPVLKTRTRKTSFNTGRPTAAPGSTARISTGQCRPPMGRLVCGTRLPIRRA